MNSRTTVRAPVEQVRDLDSDSAPTEFQEQKLNHLFGSLHGQPCLPAAFSTLSAKFGRYELIDGILKYRPMTMRSHDRRRRFMQYLGEKFILQSSNLFLQATEGSTVRSGESILIPDVAIGRSSSSSSMNYEYDGTNPNAVCEIASQGNFRDDFRKSSTYSQLGIEEYIILHVHTSFPEPVDYPFGLYRFTQPDTNSKKYLVQEFEPRGSTMITSYFGSLIVDDFVDPPDVSKLRWAEHQAAQQILYNKDKVGTE